MLRDLADIRVDDESCFFFFKKSPSRVFGEELLSSATAHCISRPITT